MARGKQQQPRKSSGGKASRKEAAFPPLSLDGKCLKMRASSIGYVIKPRKPRTMVPREIREELAELKRLVRKVSRKFTARLRIQTAAMKILQEDEENHSEELLKDIIRCALREKRITIMPKDIRSARRIREIIP